MKHQTLILLLLLLYIPRVWANPELDKIVHGEGNVEIDGRNYNFNQSSDKLIALFKSFNIDPDEITRINQPSRDAAALFRILDQDPSRILGGLSATGKLFLINPNGILFGPNAKVNVGSLTASTLDLVDDDFLNGKYSFQEIPGYVPSLILNQGEITASQGGYVALLGGAVRNEGTITAEKGSVLLSAGKRVTVSLDEDALISAAIEEPVKSKVYDFEGNPINDALNNQGTINVPGGRAILSAKAVDEVFDNVINHEGMISATSLVERNGEIILDGGDEGIVKVTGDLDASGKEPGLTGGTVKVLGNKVGLFEGASVDVSGDHGGGTALIGGNYKGEGPEPNSEAIYIDKDATVNADALTNGNGGRVIAWSDKSTRVYGTLSARGGKESGDGGFIETSSGGYLDIANLKLDASALNGKGGLWFLDPRNGSVLSSATSGGTFGGGNPDVFSPNADDFVVQASDIEARLNAGTSVTITTAGGGGQLGNFTITANISKTAGGNAALTFNIENNLTVNGTISSSAGALTVNLNADSDTNGGGDLDINAGITTNNGDLNTSGVGFDNTGGTINTGTGQVNIIHTGGVIVGASVTGGPIQITGTSVNLNAPLSNIAAANNGAIRITNSGLLSIAAAGDITSDGVFQQNGAGAVQTAGDISTTGDLLQYARAVTLTGNIVLASGGAAVEFLSSLDGAFTVTVTSGAGNVVFNGVGQTTPITGLTVNATTGDISVNTASAIVNGNIDLNGRNINFNLGATTQSGGTFTITNSGTLFTGAGINLISDGDFFQDGAGPVNLQGNVTTSDDNVAFAGAVTINQNVQVSSGAAGGGNITFQNTLNGANALTLIAGTGDVAFNSTVGNVVNLSSITISNARNVDFDNTVQTSGNLTQTTGSGTTTFDNTATIGGNANLSNDNIAFNGSGNINAGAGSVTLNAETGAITGGMAGTDVTAATIDLDAVTGIGTAPNPLQLAGTALSVDNSGLGDIRVNNSASGIVSVATLTAQTGNITFNQTGNQALLITISSTGNGTITLSNAGGNLTSTTLTTGGNKNASLTTSTSGNVLLGNVTAQNAQVTINAAGSILEAGSDDSADVTAATIDLTAGTDIGSSLNPLELNATSILKSAGGSIFINELTSLLTGTFPNSIVSTTVGDANIRDLNVSGTVEINAGGSILGAGGDGFDVTGEKEVRLIAGGQIGTQTQPLRVQVTGSTIFISSSGQTNGLSVNIKGDVNRKSVEFLNLPPGLVIYNDAILGGANIQPLETSLAGLYYDPLPNVRNDEWDGRYSDFPAVFNQDEFTKIIEPIIDDSQLKPKKA